MHPPVFLGAHGEGELATVRAALAAHPRFFTSHLPVDDEASLLEWAKVMRETPCSRRPVWVSACAFGCVEALRATLPGARFVRVVETLGPRRDACLELTAGGLREHPQAELARLFRFLGERAPQAPGSLGRCA